MDVLARVKNDLSLGHTFSATQRLRTLLAVDPADLEVRRLLATVYRQTGNLVEAGRWSFLTEDVRDEELDAFARSNASPWLRLRLLMWNGDQSGLPDQARARLVSLVDEAEQSGPPARWVASYHPPPPRGSAIPCLFVTVVIVAFGVLVAIGTVQVAVWILQ